MARVFEPGLGGFKAVRVKWMTKDASAMRPYVTQPRRSDISGSKLALASSPRLRLACRIGDSGITGRGD